HVLGGADAAAHRERDEHLFGGAPDHVVGGLAVAGRGGDVEEGQLVGALGVVHLGHLDGVAGVAQVLEVDALDDPAVVHVQAGDDSDRQGHESTAPLNASSSTETSTRASTKPSTTRRVVTGRTASNSSLCARPASSMSRAWARWRRVRITD